MPPFNVLPDKTKTSLLLAIYASINQPDLTTSIIGHVHKLPISEWLVYINHDIASLELLIQQHRESLITADQLPHVKPCSWYIGSTKGNYTNDSDQ